MKFSLTRFHLDRHAMFYMAVLAAIMLLAFHPQLAFAADTTDGASDGSSLPFVSPLKTLQNALTGPFAMSVSLIGIVAAGAVLIFGGDMSGFLRTLVFLVLVIALIVASSSFLKMFTQDSATIAAVGGQAQMLARGVASSI